MIFEPLDIAGAYRIALEKRTDDRGYFARTFCEEEFAVAGLTTRFVQSSLSFNARKGTLRGMHFQSAPHEETKLVRCTRGAAFDVLLDLRPQSSTFRRWVSVDLDEESGVSVYIPAGVAHGFKTLEDLTVLEYQISAFHAPNAAEGVRWDDPAFGIAWPETDMLTISERDASYPLQAPL